MTSDSRQAVAGLPLPSCGRLRNQHQSLICYNVNNKTYLILGGKMLFFPPLYFMIVVVVALTPHYDSPRCLAANPAVLRCPFQKARGATQMAHMPGRHKHVVNPVLKCCKIICLFHVIKYKSYHLFIYLLIFKSMPRNCQLFSIWIFFSLF